MSGKIRRIDWTPDEWLAGTTGVLKAREMAVYMTVLMQIYSRGRACPNDATFIAGHFKLDEENGETWRGITRSTRACLDQLIELGKLRRSPDGRWLTNGRADRELGKAGERILNSSRAGYASGRARRHNSPPDIPPTSRRQAADIKPTSSNSNHLARTSVRIINHQRKNTDLTTRTEAAREPSPELEAAQARAPTASNESAKINTPTKPKSASQQRLEAAAAAARAKLMKGGG
jgi:hypothetical protein